MLSQFKIERFNNLINKYLSGNATDEEAVFIEKYYRYFEHKEDTGHALSDREIELIEQRILRKLKKNINEPAGTPIVRIRNRRNVKLIAAASVLVILCAGFFFIGNHKRLAAPDPVVVQSVQVDRSPDQNKAIITLGDGSRVVLDDSEKGTISQQGNAKIIRLADGRIVYKNNGNNDSSVVINTLATPRGARCQLVLIDGTKVWMNAASSISYPTIFIGDERKVKITGEVYFEVAKNSKQPFHVVIDDHSEITVLGTSFNVNAYADRGTVITTLLNGSIRVKRDSEEKTLKPGQQAEVAGTFKIVDNISIDFVMAWKNGYFNFNNDGLQIVMKQLARWYDVDVVYEENAPDMKFWGSINRNATLSEVLKILEESGVFFRIDQKKIIVLSKRR